MFTLLLIGQARPDEGVHAEIEIFAVGESFVFPTNLWTITHEELAQRMRPASTLFMGGAVAGGEMRVPRFRVEARPQELSWRKMCWLAAFDDCLAH